MAITEVQVGWTRLNADGTEMQKRERMGYEPNLMQRPGQPYWVPSFEITDDQSTGTKQTKQQSGEWLIEAAKDRVSRTTVIEDYTDEEINKTIDDQATSYVETLAGKIGFDVENDIRVLEGKQPFDRAQYEQWVKGFINA